jgi:hypothetical protein
MRIDGKYAKKRKKMKTSGKQKEWRKEERKDTMIE